MAEDVTEADVREAGGRTRLFVGADLGEGMAVPLDEAQAHYLIHVMRAKAGDRVRLFNGRDGEWTATIETVTKRGVVLKATAQTESQKPVPDIWLVFAPVKKTPADYLAQKATELGVRRLQPVFTRRTIVTRVNEERLLANAVEAAEQSDRLSVPEIAAPLTLEKLLNNWPAERRLYFCDEGGDAQPLAKAAAAGPAAILTGPEGGFDPAEREMLRGLPFVTPVTLGPRILRADTAALAALAVWQSVAGDFQA
ncbi:MAG TPA: 16S rRNA (uracil(1498)-N(3))-methyltransferase [Rhizomicrobium sp.]|nr:16S rRNA (uracil(1498)-N(3))-methyltransferase [Rhizomicrobium sp.]